MAEWPVSEFAAASKIHVSFCAQMGGVFCPGSLKCDSLHFPGGLRDDGSYYQPACRSRAVLWHQGIEAQNRLARRLLGIRAVYISRPYVKACRSTVATSDLLRKKGLDTI